MIEQKLVKDYPYATKWILSGRGEFHILEIHDKIKNKNLLNIQLEEIRSKKKKNKDREEGVRLKEEERTVKQEFDALLKAIDEMLLSVPNFPHTWKYNFCYMMAEDGREVIWHVNEFFEQEAEDNNMLCREFWPEFREASDRLIALQEKIWESEYRVQTFLNG